MDRRQFTLSLLGAAVASLSGCGGGGGGGGSVVVGPELASATSLTAATMFLQTITETDGDRSVAPGQANSWELSQDFSISDGSDDQFDGALELSVDVGGNVEDFASDQTFAELTAFGPELGAADGVKLVSFTTDAAFVVNGTTSAALHPVPNARLQQTLNLGTAVAPINLTWVGTDNAGTYDFNDEPFFLQVVIRDAIGALLATLYRHDATGTFGSFGGGTDISAFAGQTVVLSFEHRSTETSATLIDDVSVLDANTVEFVTNGDFEAGGSGWTVPAVNVSQNVRSGVRTLNGLEVQRMFFTQPNQLWARMTDEFFNPTASAIDAKAIYFTNLGSDSSGIIYDTPGAVGKAITTWDGDNRDRDVGFVFGMGTTVTYTSDDLGNGSDNVTFEFDISVPAGGRVTLVNFVIMTGTDTADTAVDATAKATQVDAQAVDIANNARTNLAYARGMTQQQLDSLKNF